MKISLKKREKIAEQILAYLFSQNPKSIFTAHIAQEIARDEEFVKTILLDMKKKNFLVEVKKNKQGVDYIRRARWKLSEKTYIFYKNSQF